MQAAGDQEISTREQMAESGILIPRPVRKYANAFLIALEEHGTNGGGNGGEIFCPAAAHLKNEIGVLAMGDENIQMAQNFRGVIFSSVRHDLNEILTCAFAMFMFYCAP